MMRRGESETNTDGKGMGNPKLNNINGMFVGMESQRKRLMIREWVNSYR